MALSDGFAADNRAVEVGYPTVASRISDLDESDNRLRRVG